MSEISATALRPLGSRRHRREADLRRGRQRGAAPLPRRAAGDAALRRGHRQAGRCLRRHPRAAPRLRRARLRHPDQRVGDPRLRRGRGHARPPSHRRDHVGRLLAGGLRPDRQPAGERALRQPRGAAGTGRGAHPAGLRPGSLRPAQPEPGGVLPARSGPAGVHAVDRPGRLRPARRRRVLRRSDDRDREPHALQRREAGGGARRARAAARRVAGAPRGIRRHARHLGGDHGTGRGGRVHARGAGGVAGGAGTALAQPVPHGGCHRAGPANRQARRAARGRT